MNTHERRTLVLTIIQKNYRISHNNLLTVIKELDGMAKTTSENTIQELVDENLIYFTIEGNKKLYAVSYSFPSDPESIKKFVDNTIEILSSQLEMVLLTSKQCTIIEKTRLIAFFINVIFGHDNNITMIKVVNPSVDLDAQRQKIYSILRKSLSIFANDKKSIEKYFPIMQGIIGGHSFRAGKELLAFMESLDTKK